MATDVFYCARHPSTETLLRCGRCDTLICPRCVVMTDVGARCPECAPSRKLPQFELGPVWIARGLGASAVAAGVIGTAWGYLLPDIAGFFSIFLGLGIGWAVSESVSLSTNRKFGPVLQLIAAAGVVGAYFLRNLIGLDELLPTNDLGGYLAVGVGVLFAINRLRF